LRPVWATEQDPVSERERKRKAGVSIYYHQTFSIIVFVLQVKADEEKNDKSRYSDNSNTFEFILHLSVTTVLHISPK
jgi:hypothetical protein